MSTVARFSIATYDRMIAAGAFEPREDHHVELIRGEMREMMSPIGTTHAAIIDRLGAWSIRHAPAEQVIARVQNPVQFDALVSVPKPDIVWARKKNYFEHHPEAEDVLLLIEVAESSLTYDRGEKAELYAEAEIGEYWIVNTSDRTIEVYRNPAEKRYRQMQTFAAGDSIAPQAFPQVPLAVASLWPAKS